MQIENCKIENSSKKLPHKTGFYNLNLSGNKPRSRNEFGMTRIRSLIYHVMLQNLFQHLLFHFTYYVGTDLTYEG